MIRRLLIANRGEIALRILRACRVAGIETVAAYSRADRNLLHLDYADQLVCVSRVDYRDADSLLMAAKTRGCDAVHPGYGFLAENAAFAERVTAEGLVWVGPDHHSIALMGDKSRARSFAAAHGLEPVPGSEGNVPDVARAREIASSIGYPVVLKATFGGGGRGIRLVQDEAALIRAFDEVQTEAHAISGQADIYLEKFLDRARHIEIQVLGDGCGNAVHAGSRECSIQRRHQKVIEEAPAPGIEPAVLSDLGEACARAVAAMNYRNAGTLEFLYQDGEFRFIEMNTRIQVEHPLTEMTTGLDLVRMQLEIAASGGLPLTREAIEQRGHAIECRINAEDAAYRPSPGLVSSYIVPGGPGVRMDSHMYAGYRIPHEYDSLIGKLICHGADRAEAIARMETALAEFSIRGVDTNTGLLRRILASESFRAGKVNTGFLEDFE